MYMNNSKVGEHKTSNFLDKEGERNYNESLSGITFGLNMNNTLMTNDKGETWRNNDGNPDHYLGSMCDFRIFETALSQGEIEYMYRSEYGLMVHYKFHGNLDDSTGTVSYTHLRAHET